jgi:hypothetical protein
MLAGGVAMLEFLDLCDLVVLTRQCSWQRRKVIRYLTFARTLRLGHADYVPNHEHAEHEHEHENDGKGNSINIQAIAFNIMARYCRHLRSLDCAWESSSLCISGAILQQRYESAARGSSFKESDDIECQARLHIDIRLAQTITNCSTTWNVVPLIRCSDHALPYSFSDRPTSSSSRVLTSLLSCTSLTRVILNPTSIGDEGFVPLLSAYTSLLQKNVSLPVPSLTHLVIPLQFLYAHHIVTPHRDRSKHDDAIKSFRTAVIAMAQLQHINGDYLIDTIELIHGYGSLLTSTSTISDIVVPMRGLTTLKLSMIPTYTPDLSPLTNLTSLTVHNEYSSNSVPDDGTPLAAKAKVDGIVTTWKLPKLQELNVQSRLNIVIDAPRCTKYTTSCLFMPQLRSIVNGNMASLTDISWYDFPAPLLPPLSCH